MPTNPNLSFIGLYNWDSSLFDLMEIPTREDYPIDKNVLIDLLLMETAELEVIYPDFDFMKQALGRYSVSRKNSWERMLEALSEKYNPLHNFDRNEEYTDNETGNNTSSNTNTVTGTTTEQTTGFDSETFVDRGKQDISGNTSSTGNSNATRQLTHTARLFGNIGVTKSQEMLKDELEVRKTDFYKIVVEEIKNRFCLLVY